MQTYAAVKVNPNVHVKMCVFYCLQVIPQLKKIKLALRLLPQLPELCELIFLLLKIHGPWLRTAAAFCLQSQRQSLPGRGRLGPTGPPFFFPFDLLP